MDPGGRTFQTTYSESEIIEIGKDVGKDMANMLNERDRIHKEYTEILTRAKREKVEKNEIRNKKRRYLKEEEKIGNRINDLHYKAINKLMKYGLIMIPKMNVRKMLEEKKLPKMARR